MELTSKFLPARPSVRQIKYPCLMIFRDPKLVVLADSDRSCTVVSKGSSGYTVGQRLDNFYLAHAEVYEGTITLTQTL